ncbi:OmpA family protein, partial [Arenibaculum sp.]|uniref:OmpA family protein n=1 Tax=Arenibaculum sp. TaxID=2865862 RepID=UPI002E0F59DF|nr:OmpA family protein [Arenibaculum sp.]
PGPLPDFALAPLPVPEDPLGSRPAPAADPALADPLPVPPPLPDLSPRGVPAPAMRPPPPGPAEQDMAALLAPPPDPGPDRAVELPAGNEFSIVFDEGAAELEAAEKELLTGIAARMARNQNARLQIRSYATTPERREPDARRLALRRAVDLRRLLVEQGVRSTRIDVRALGTADAGPTDRVDLVLVN